MQELKLGGYSMINILQQLEEVEIQQILALQPKVSVEEAFRLYKQKMALVNAFHNQQLVKRVERLVRPSWFKRVIDQIFQPQ